MTFLVFLTYAIVLGFTNLLQVAGHDTTGGQSKHPGIEHYN